MSEMHSPTAPIASSASAPAKLREIERLRAVAVLFVVCTHAPFMGVALPKQMNELWSGVDLFFVISGFVVTRALLRTLPDLTAVDGFDVAFERARGALTSFYVRRFFRIVPMALVGIVVARLLVESGWFELSRDKWRREAIAVLLGVYNYAMPTLGHDQLGVYWSLSVEEHFYLILPLIFLGARTRSRRILAAFVGVAFVTLITRPFFGEPPPGLALPIYYARFSSHLRFDSLFAGVAASLLFMGERGRPFLPKRWMQWVILPTCVLLLGALPSTLGAPLAHRVGFPVMWFISGVLVVYASFDADYVLPVPVVSRLLEHIGARSYAIYILHVPLLKIEGKWVAAHPAIARYYSAPPWGPWIRLAAFVAMTLLICEVSWRILEAPMQRLGRVLTEPQARPVNLRLVQGSVLVLSFGLLALMYQHTLFATFGPRNLALGKPVLASSQIPEASASQLTNGELEDERGFHTMREAHPFAIVDLQREATVRGFRVYNRADGWQTEGLPIHVEVSLDGVLFTRVGTRTSRFTQWSPWSAEISPIRARYVRLSSDAAYLCVAELEVFGP
jgi:peptidoglycan/LPS O-acetylase OafA/YrhL